MPTAAVRRDDPALSESVSIDPVRFRARVADAVEQLIALLDRIDGDADFEPDGSDEPSLGFLEGRSQLRINAGSHDDREADADFEPSLGFVQSCGSQLGINAGARDDREDEHDGAEPEDAEPNLASTPQEEATGVYADGWVTDGEEEHDGREPEPDFEEDHRGYPAEPEVAP